MSTVNFSNIAVSEENTIGGFGAGKIVANELLSYGNFYLGSAVVGFMKKLLGE